MPRPSVWQIGAMPSSTQRFQNTIVVVRRIVGDRAPVRRIQSKMRRFARHFGPRRTNLGGDHHGLVAEFEHGELELANRFFRRVRRHDRDRAHAVFGVAKYVGVHRVHRACERDAQVFVLQIEIADPIGGEHVGEIDAALVHARLEEVRQHRHGSVGGVRARRRAPPDALGPDAGIAAPQPFFGHCRPGHFAHVAFDGEERFDDVRVGIDDRMIELGANVASRKAGISRHG